MGNKPSYAEVTRRSRKEFYPPKRGGGLSSFPQNRGRIRPVQGRANPSHLFSGSTTRKQKHSRKHQTDNKTPTTTFRGRPLYGQPNQQNNRDHHTRRIGTINSNAYRITHTSHKKESFYIPQPHQPQDKDIQKCREVF